MRVSKLFMPVVLGSLILVSTGCSRGSSPTATPGATAETAGPVGATSTGGATPGVARATSAATPTPTRGAATAARATPGTPGGATPWGSPLPTLPSGQVYKDPQARFSFTIPSNWVQVQAAGAEVAFQSPAAQGAVPATVNVVVEKLPSASVSLDEYDQAGETNLKQQFSDYKPIRLDKVSVDGRPAYKRLYTATIANRLLELQQVYLIDRDTAYIVSCGASQDTFQSYVAVFDQISGTFKLGAP
jgi:hypothetical protein